MGDTIKSTYMLWLHPSASHRGHKGEGSWRGFARCTVQYTLVNKVGGWRETPDERKGRSCVVNSGEFGTLDEPDVLKSPFTAGYEANGRRQRF